MGYKASIRICPKLRISVVFGQKPANSRKQGVFTAAFYLEDRRMGGMFCFRKQNIPPPDRFRGVLLRSGVQDGRAISFAALRTTPECHSERSEESKRSFASLRTTGKVLRFAQDDRQGPSLRSGRQARSFAALRVQ